jgi:uncharacterized protein with NRDE domain
MKDEPIDPVYLDSLAKRTLLRKNLYNAFNLFFGSLNDLTFYSLGSTEDSAGKIGPGYGSFCNHVDVERERLNKQKHGLELMEKAVEGFKSVPSVD